MFQDKPEWIAHQRQRWLRPDAERWLRPDAHRWLTPEAQRWLLPDRKLRPQLQPDDHGLDLAAEREWLRRMRGELASLKAELKFRQFFRSLKAGFNPSQPRDDRGRWTDTGGEGAGNDAGGGEASDQESDQSDPNPRVADAGFGILVVELSRRGGRDCVYRFAGFSVIISGPTNFRCQASVHWSAVTHGQLLNDNRPR